MQRSRHATRARRRGTWLCLLTCALWMVGAPVVSAGRPTFEPLDASDRAQIQRQREVVAELARRHAGREPRGGLSDLRLLQALVDQRRVAPSQTFELQALGVVLGDVMAAELALEWVIVVDDRGRSRALRYGSTSNVFFPITMISRRIEREAPVNVRALYDEVAAEIQEIEASKRRRPGLPWIRPDEP